MNRPDVTEWQGAERLPLALQVILVVATTALPTWKVHAFGHLALHLPKRSPFRAKPPPHVYVGLQASAEEILSLAVHRHHAEGVVIIIDKLGPSQTRPWMKGLNKFSIADRLLLVTPHLMAWLAPEELRPMQERW